MGMLRLIRLYFRPAGLDFASGLAGLSGGILGMKNAGDLPRGYNYYQDGYDANSELWNALQSITQGAKTANPQLNAAYQNLLGIDTSGLIGAGEQAGQQFGGLADLAQLYGGQLGQQANQQFSAGQDIYNLARDPNNQLHDRMQQQVVDANRSGQSARGIGMSPYGAGLENQAVSNFNMDWQNNLLNRASTGINSMDQANYLGGMDLGNSMASFGQAPGYTMSAGQAPIQAQQTAYGLPIDWTQMYMQGLGSTQGNVASGMGSYLQGTQGAQNQMYSTDLQRADLHNQMQQQAQYGLAGGGQSSTNFMGGSQSGFGNPMNWIGMGGMGGG